MSHGDRPRTPAAWDAELARLEEHIRHFVTHKPAGRVGVAVDDDLKRDYFVPRLQAITGSNPDALLYVRGYRAINYGRVVEVMSLVSTAGFHKVSLIAESPKGAPGKTASGSTSPDRSTRAGKR